MAKMITQEEAADVLDVSVRQLNRLCHAGILTAHYLEGGEFSAPRTFNEADVMAYLEIRDKKINVSTLAVIARQAYVASRAVERQLEQVTHYLGLNLPHLSHRRQDVMRLYVQVEDALEIVDRDIKPDKIIEWARIFYAIGEEYLWLIEDLLEDPEPWKNLLELANTLYKNAPRETFNENKRLASAYGFLNAGRINLRSVSYFYIRNKHGDRVASLMFPASQGDRTERIINLAFPDQQSHP